MPLPECVPSPSPRPSDSGVARRDPRPPPPHATAREIRVRGAGREPPRAVGLTLTPHSCSSAAPSPRVSPPDAILCTNFFPHAGAAPAPRNLRASTAPAQVRTEVEAPQALSPGGAVGTPLSLLLSPALLSPSPQRDAPMRTQPR